MDKLINVDKDNKPYLKLDWEDYVSNDFMIFGPTIHKLHKLEEAYEELLEEIDCLKTERTELKDKIEFMEKEWENFEKAFSQVGTIISCSENHRVYCGECAHSEVCSADNQLIKRLNGDKCKHYNKKNKKK